MLATICQQIVGRRHSSATLAAAYSVNLPVMATVLGIFTLLCQGDRRLVLGLHGRHSRMVCPSRSGVQLYMTVYVMRL